MTKKNSMGGKNRKKGKGDPSDTKRELVFREEGEDYGLITKLLGNCNVMVDCTDGESRIGHIRGAFRKKVWMKTGDLVLVSLRDYQDGKADVVHVYKPDEMRMLRSYNELPERFGKTGDDAAIAENDESEVVDFEIDDI